MIRSLLGKKFPVSRLALTLGLSSSLLAMGNAAAQEVSNPTTARAPETAEADRVIVTGSNIPTSEEVGAAPVDTIDQTARDRTGQEDILGVLSRSDPAFSGGGNIGQANGSINAQATLGGSQVLVHGLPTLTLLNGRRVASASAAALGGSVFSDVNLFPTALVKRVEVLKDGASAIYGSEAIGGVVNVITDEDFTGFDFSARFGFAERGDIQDQRYSGIVGLGDAKTKIVLAAQYVEQDPIKDSQRDYSSPSLGGTTTFPGVIRLGPNFNGGAAAGTQPFLLSPTLGSPTQNNPANPGVPTTVAGLAPGTYTPASLFTVGQSFDLAPRTNITQDQNRLSIIGSFERQLFDKYVVAFGDLLYSSNYSQSQLNGQPLSNATGVVIPATAPYNPFGTTVDGSTLGGPGAIQVANRFVDSPRVTRADTDFYRVVAGLKGEIIKDLTYEIALNTSRDETTAKYQGLIIGTELNNAIAGGFAADGSSALAGVDINPATGALYAVNGPFSVVGGNLQPALNFFARTNPAAAQQGFIGTNEQYLESKLSGVDGKLTYFLPFKLPAGLIGLAAGGEYRDEKLRGIFSPGAIFLGNTNQLDINVQRTVRAGFAEISIPVVSPDMKVPGVYSFDVDAAGRYEHYSDAGDSYVPKVSAVYRPIQDIALRASYSQSFIAPTLYETGGPITSGFSTAVGGDQAQEEGGSNPTLAPSTADTYTAGIVISPRFVKGLTLNLDFFHVDQKDIVGSIPDTSILSDVNTLGGASQYAGLVHQGGFGGPTAAALGLAPGALYANLPNYFIIDNEANLGGVRVGGVDFGMNYVADFKKFGELTLGINGTYFFQYKQQNLPGQPFYDTVGFYQGLANAVPQYKLAPYIGYRFGGATVSALMNYTPSLRDAHDPVDFLASGASLDVYNKDVDGYYPKIRDYYTIDLRLGYEFGLNKPEPEAVPAPKDGKDHVVSGKDGKDVVAASSSNQMAHTMMASRLLDGLKLEFGITNVTNARPPLIQVSPDATNSDGSLYDPYQRYYYFVISKKF